MQQKQEATSTVSQEQSDFVPIFKMELPNYPHLEVIEGYHEFFKTKVPGSWLMRESRVPGMISVTFKQENRKVGHTRFAFVADKWLVVNNDMRNKHTEGSSLINYEHVDRMSVKSKFELLLEAIYKSSEESTSKFVFENDKMIEPVAEQATQQRAYYIDTAGYTPVKQRTKDQAIYANLLQSLESVKKAMRDCMNDLSTGTELKERKMDCLDKIQISYKKSDLSHILRDVSKPFQSDNSDALELKELLEVWLEENSLTFDLMCPVLHALFEEPYYVVETGMVYDAAALFHKGQCLETCPLTKTNIEYNPVHFGGYRKALYETLEQFFDLIQLYQEKMSLAKERKEDFSSLPLFSVFAPATSNEASSVVDESLQNSTKVESEAGPFNAAFG
ncbi:MAG: hypothetical protein P4L79_15920 [Legionella sp.]|uniref:hypothetical protein n=1 Tax=Legionella sp. TaxID=459 RepID=UPI002843E73B|nr:hypothetical protein [Legionella sp.]